MDDLGYITGPDNAKTNLVGHRDGNVTVESNKDLAAAVSMLRLDALHLIYLLSMVFPECRLDHMLRPSERTGVIFGIGCGKSLAYFGESSGIQCFNEAKLV